MAIWGIYLGSASTPVLHVTPEVASFASFCGVDPHTINSFSVPIGACAYAEGNFLIDFAGLKALRKAAGGSQKVRIVLQSQDQTAPDAPVSFQAYLDHVTPIHQASSTTGWFLATMVDWRKYAAAEPFSSAAANGYGITIMGERGNYIGGSSATLQQLLSDAAGDWGGSVKGTVSSSYLAIDWTSSGSYAGEPAAVVIDHVCKVVGFGVDALGGIRDFASSSLTALQSASPANGSTGAFAKRLMAGGLSHDLNNTDLDAARVPSSINVLFPLAGLNGSPNLNPTSLEPYSFFTVNVSSQISPSNPNYQEMVYDNFWVKGTPGNIPSSEITAATTRANQIAEAYVRRFKLPLGRWRLKGWFYDSQWMAHVRFGFLDGVPITDVWLDATDVTMAMPGRGRKIYGDGGIVVSQAADGSARISNTVKLGCFAVLVKHNGGSAGSNTTNGGATNHTCDATYDLFDITDSSMTTKLNTDAVKSPEYDRAKFSGAYWTIALPADGSVGWAYWDAASPPVIHLWQTLETPSEGC